MAKKRNQNTATEKQGVIALRSYCAQNNLVFQAEPDEDFGIDCYIEVVIADNPRNFIIGAQCKSGPSYKRAIQDDGSFTLYASQDDLTYWAAANYPIFLVYYDSDADILYYRHVQAALESSHSANPAAFRFTAQDAASSSANSMAEYARKLTSVTPSILDRLEILKNQLDIVANGSTYQIQQNSPNGLLKLSEVIQPEGQNQFCLMESTVLGYSPDDRWILQVLVTHLGEKCTAYHALFLDTKVWGQLIIPIYTEQDFDAERNPSIEDCAESLSRVQARIEHLNICPGPTVYSGLKYYADLDMAPAMDLAFCWGAAKFYLALRMLYDRDVLVLENRKYVPARAAHLAMESVGWVYLLESGEELWSEEQRTRMGHVAAISHSASGKTVSIATMSNQSHPCYGHPELRFFHFRVDELRDLCIDALRV